VLSEFLPTAYFGGLVGFTMIIALAADLLLLPALMLMFGEKATSPQREST
jgi:predicted RND superfamily exporter protein